MTLRGLRIAVCLLAALTTVLPAWAADANTCSAGGVIGGFDASGGSRDGEAGGATEGGSSGADRGSGAVGASGGSAHSTGGTAASSAVGISPSANSVAPARKGGAGLGTGTAIRAVGNGDHGGIDAGGDSQGTSSQQGARPYSLRAIYFRRDQFRNQSDCLKAASTQRLPLEVCQ